MKNLGILFSSIPLLTSCGGGNVDSKESLEAWVKENKTFCKETVSINKSTFYFNDDNTFKLDLQTKPGGAYGHDFTGTHYGKYSVKSGKYWKSKEKYYYIELSYNDTKWAGYTKKGYLVYDDGELITPTSSGHKSIKDDSNGFEQFYINIALGTNTYVKCN